MAIYCGQLLKGDWGGERGGRRGSRNGGGREKQTQKQAARSEEKIKTERKRHTHTQRMQATDPPSKKHRKGDIKEKRSHTTQARTLHVERDGHGEARASGRDMQGRVGGGGQGLSSSRKIVT